MQQKKFSIQSDSHSSSAVLLTPENPNKTGVILAHGAGGNMNQPFMEYFQRGLAESGYMCMKFNFFYSEARRKAPDPQPLLLRCFDAAIDSMPTSNVVIGGKSMGGRMASYIAGNPRVTGLLFLGYPLHAPGKTDQLRDQHLYSIKKPMLFASGTRDPFAKLDLLQGVIKKIGTDATAHFVEDGGHSFEVPKKSGLKQTDINSAVLSSILTWLETLNR